MSPQRPTDVAAIERWDRLLDGKVAVVTGGGEGIGAAISLLFARHGATVEIADVDADRADRSRRAIAEIGGAARAHVVDVTDAAGVARLASDVLGEHGHIDVLVNNVGDYRPLVRFEESTPESWQAMYDINLLHVFAVTRAFLDSMTARRKGSIITIHSVEGMRGYPGDPVYAAMKAAAAHFTTSLAVSVGRRGIRVNGIAPDLTQTPQVDYLGGSEAHDELWASWAPVGRAGLARGPGAGGSLPGLGPVGLRHRAQHPGRRRDQGRRRLVLLPHRPPVRQPPHHPLSSGRPAARLPGAATGDRRPVPPDNGGHCPATARHGPLGETDRADHLPPRRSTVTSAPKASDTVLLVSTSSTRPATTRRAPRIRAAWLTPGGISSKWWVTSTNGRDGRVRGQCGETLEESLPGAEVEARGRLVHQQQLGDWTSAPVPPVLVAALLRTTARTPVQRSSGRPDRRRSAGRRPRRGPRRCTRSTRSRGLRSARSALRRGPAAQDVTSG